jgi:hypothetical protein
MRYRLTLTTQPASEPVTLDEAKAQLRITTDDEDALIAGYIQTAREQAEMFTSRAFLPQTFTMYLDGFPSLHRGFRAGHGISLRGSVDPLLGMLLSSAGEIQIPRGPIISVDSISYIDTTGTQQFLNSSQYQVDPQSDDDLVRIMPAYGSVWPATRYVPNAVVIQFHAGYVDVDHLPQSVKLAMKQTIGDWYQNREAIVVDSRVAVQQLPNAAKMLLWNYRLF